MENYSQKSRKSRVLKALEYEEIIIEDNHNGQSENKLVVDDLQTFIAKAVYGDQFKGPVPAFPQRMKQLEAWQTVRLDLTEKILELIQDIELLEKRAMMKASAGKISEKAIDTTSMPDNIKAILNLSDGNMVTLGPNGTQIRPEVFLKMNWNLSNANITRKILMELFDRETLATHTLSGKPSPAFVGCNKPTKMQLNPDKVQDIIHILTNSLEMTAKEVRQAITTKCADENKMLRQREERRCGITRRRRANGSDNKAFCA